VVFSYYLARPFYSLVWRIMKSFGKCRHTVFYCHTPVDMEIWLPVQKHLKAIPVVTDKRRTYKELRAAGYQCRMLPAFPKAVVMCRVASHKFPSSRVIKIGMNHGAYHFKRMTAAANYKPFSLFMFTSPRDLANAQKRGVTCGKAVGFPKLDPWLGQPAKPGTGKPRVLFTATYDASGMSAVHLWADRLGEIIDEFEIYVTLHPWIGKHYAEQIRNTPGVHFIEGESPLPYIRDCDVCIGDTSSILAECCAFDKPLVTWILPSNASTVPEVISTLERCSLRIRNFDELLPAIKHCLDNPGEKQWERRRACQMFFGQLDNRAGERAAAAIMELLPELKP
jgi:hypothetical protein